MKADFVGELLEVLRAAGVDDVSARRVEREVRQRWGDQSVRVRARAPVTVDVIEAGLRERKPVRLIAAEQEVSRQTVYRMLKLKSPKARA